MAKSNTTKEDDIIEAKCLIDAGYSITHVVATMKKSGVTIEDVLRRYDECRAETAQWLAKGFGDEPPVTHDVEDLLDQIHALKCIEPAAAKPAGALQHYRDLLDDHIQEAEETGCEKAKDALAHEIRELSELIEELRTHI